MFSTNQHITCTSHRETSLNWDPGSQTFLVIHIICILYKKSILLNVHHNDICSFDQTSLVSLNLHTISWMSTGRYSSFWTVNIIAATCDDIQLENQSVAKIYYTSTLSIAIYMSWTQFAMSKFGVVYSPNQTYHCTSYWKPQNRGTHDSNINICVQVDYIQFNLYAYISYIVSFMSLF